MADTDPQTGGMVVVSADHLSDMSQAANLAEGVEDVGEEDILSQALVDVSEFPDGVEIQYQDEGENLQESSMINSNSDGVTFIASDSIDQVSGDQLAEHFVNGTYQVLDADQNVSDGGYAMTMNEEISITNGTQGDIEGEGELGFQKIENESIMCAEQSADISETPVSHQQVVSIPQATSVTIAQPPLGSSQNPIRIIQQGNQYTPVQHLSTEQLQQIMQVVQQQQMTSTIESGSSVLFNPQTNTRIVYRVIYPSELHKEAEGVATSMQTVGSVQTSPKKMYKKRTKEEDADARDQPSLSKEEKEMRKKVRAKTRSGRVSKPPKHMVKDFKHIHVLDYDEDYDDSDGGYSDYKVDESDGDEQQSKDESDTYIIPGLNSTKPKNWKCVTCERAYIGRAGLGRHLKLNPSHGSIDVEGFGEMVPPPPGTEIIMNGTALTPDNTPNVSTSNGIITNGTANSTASLSEDSRDSSYSLPYTPTPVRRGGQRGRPRGGRGWRGRGAYKVDPEVRKRNRLKDLVRECTDEELMEIVLPRLAKVITLWEFLLMKVEKGDPAKPHADDVYTEYEKLHVYVKKLCQEYLQYVPETDLQKDMKILKVENGAVAEALGLQTGAHKVKEISESDSNITYTYKLLNTNKSVHSNYANKSFLKRTVENLSPEQIISPTKRIKNGPEIFPGSQIKSSVSKDIKPINTSVPTNSVTSESSVIFPTTTVNMNMSTTNSVSTTNLTFSTTSSAVDVSHGNLINPHTNTSYPKVVSLLSNSVLKKGRAPVQQKAAQPSQKYIIASGINPSSSVSAAGTSNHSLVFDGNLRSTEGNSGESSFIITPPSSQQTFNNISNNDNTVLSQQYILQTGENVSQQTQVKPQSNVLSTSSTASSPIFVTLPWSSPSALANNPGVSTCVQQTHLNQKDSSDSMASIISQGTDTPQPIVECDPETHTELGDPGSVGLDDLTPQHSETASMFTMNGESQSLETKHGEEVAFTVNSGGMLDECVAVDTKDVNRIKLGSETKSHVEEIIGLNSIDASEPSAGTADINGSLVDSKEEVGLNEEVEFPAQFTSVKLTNDASDDNHSELYQYEESCGNQEQVETIQIPATNIFQTEDGAIFIQNQDGTFIQVQSSDGQNISMETVQALLANGGATDFLEEQDQPDV